MRLNLFLSAVDRLGATPQERAQKLGITTRRLQQWQKGDLPRILTTLAENPELAAALAGNIVGQEPKQSSLTS